MARQVAYDRLYRSRNAHLAGVCSGIAKRYEFDPIVIRILFVLVTLMTVGFGVLVYVALWVSVPKEPESPDLYEILPEHAESNAYGDLDYRHLHEFRADSDVDRFDKLPIVARVAIATGLMILFLVVAVSVAPIVSKTYWWQFWPIAFLIAGLCLIVVPRPTQYGSVWHALGIVMTSVAAGMLPMSLGVVPWETLPHAFAQMWILIAAALVLFLLGLYRRVDALILAAAFLIAAFCLITLFAFPVLGDADALLISMPDGRFLRIALISL